MWGKPLKECNKWILYSSIPKIIKSNLKDNFIIVSFIANFFRHFIFLHLVRTLNTFIGGQHWQQSLHAFGPQKDPRRVLQQSGGRGPAKIPTEFPTLRGIISSPFVDFSDMFKCNASFFLFSVVTKKKIFIYSYDINSNKVLRSRLSRLRNLLLIQKCSIGIYTEAIILTLLSEWMKKRMPLSRKVNIL